MPTYANALAHQQANIPATAFRSVVAGLVEIGVIVGQAGKANKSYHVPSLGDKQRLYEVSLEALGKGFPDAL